jgi:dTDP-glucose pyrophosphorylase
MKIAIIPAAGSATRFKELGKQYAKTVLPYKGKPIIVHIVEQIKREVKPDLIRVVYSKIEHKEQIAEALALYNLDVEFVMCESGRQGPAKSILSGIPRDVTNNDSIFVHLSDFVSADPSVLNMMDDSIAAFRVSDPSRWCMVSADEHNEIINFIDKPTGDVDTNLAVAGLYSFSDARCLLYSGSIAESDGTGEFQISELMTAYMRPYPLSVNSIGSTDLVDFGTIEEYIQNRGIAKARSFNVVNDLGHSVEKFSLTNPEKILAEANWLNNPPYGMEKYVPNIYRINYNPAYLRMEKIKSTNLRDLYLYLDRSENTWNEVFDEVYHFIDSCKKQINVGNSFWKMIIQKTKDRAPEEVEFHEELTKAIEESRFFGEQTYYHGDLHFANMFYCFTYKDLKVVDPRGEFHGHWFYDLAKLNHSVNGKYDWIDSQLYSENKIYDSGTEGVKKAFATLLDDLGLTPEDHKLLNMLTASLFLSMIPLHYHSRKNQELYMEEFRRLNNSPN